MTDFDTNIARFEYLLRRGDDMLVLGHRLSEWCGHGPMLEEDIALTNISLDCIGQARNLLSLAGEIESCGRDEDALAYLRDTTEFRNCLLVEQPNQDFAVTVARQFLVDSYNIYLYQRLAESSDKRLAGIAEKAVKEIRYHLRHASEWMIRLGDGTDESHQRAQSAIDSLWMYTGELFEVDGVDEVLSSEKIAPLPSSLKDEWAKSVENVLKQATLSAPSRDCYMQTGSRLGRHSEHLGFILAEMQILPRSYPNATW